MIYFTEHSADLFAAWGRKNYPTLTWTILSGNAVGWGQRDGKLAAILYGTPGEPNEDWEPVLRAFVEMYR